MEFDPMTWEPYSFYRRPEWRWLLGQALRAKARVRFSPPDDRWLDAVAKVLGGTVRKGSTAAAVAAASQVWNGEPLLRGELEAWLLTDMPFPEIALRCHLEPRVVEAYEAVFFAVRKMRKATDWLLARAVGYSGLRGFTEPLPAAAWKLAAFRGGRYPAELVIAAMCGRKLPLNAFRARRSVRKAEECYLRLKVCTWVMSMDAVSDVAFARFLRARQYLRRLEVDLGLDCPITREVAIMEDFLLKLPDIIRGKKRGRSPSTNELDGVAGSRKTTICDPQQVLDDLAAAVEAIGQKDDPKRKGSTPTSAASKSRPRRRAA